jgi:hypothetical protein
MKKSRAFAFGQNQEILREQRMRMMKWNPRTTEDKLLYAYWQQVQGRIYTEVPLAGRQGAGSWSSHSTTRRLDGVRVIAQPGEDDIFSFRGLRREFFRLIQHHQPELIEVKRKLNRTAIGQILAGNDLFTHQYCVEPGNLIIVCASGDSALEWVCTKRNIVVVKLQDSDLNSGGG